MHTPLLLVSALQVLRVVAGEIVVPGSGTPMESIYAYGMDGKTMGSLEVRLDDDPEVQFKESRCYDGDDEKVVPKDFPRELEELPPHEIYAGVFAGTAMNASSTAAGECRGDDDRKKPFKIPGMEAYVHDDVLTAEESRTIMELSKTWKDDYMRPQQFTITHVNLSTIPLAPGTPSLKERMGRLLGADPNTIPDVVPFKKIFGVQKGLRNHIDNAGFTEATVILYFQNVKSGAVAFPAHQVAVLPRVGRAVTFTSRTKNGTVDFGSIHHTIDYDEAQEGGEHRLSLAFAVKILGGADEEWFNGPHEVSKLRRAGWCHGGAAASCPAGTACTPNAAHTCDDFDVPCGSSKGPNKGKCDGNGNCVSNVNCFRNGRTRSQCKSVGGAGECRFISRRDPSVKQLIAGMTPEEKSKCITNWLGCRPDFGLVGSCFFSCRTVCLANQCIWHEGEGCTVPLGRRQLKLL